jgi:hypothetical protein
MTDLSPQIQQAANDPLSASADGQSATARSMADLILAETYLASRAAATRPKSRGLRFTKLSPAGCFPDANGTGRVPAFDGGNMGPWW